MSLFQCEFCGCCENTALACQGCNGYAETFFDWTGIEDRKGKKLCSACAPTEYANNEGPTAFGKWHGEFPRRYLPMGMFKTGKNGNLEHKETGEQDIAPYVLPNFDVSRATAGYPGCLRNNMA
jgi:hypothetical protein